MNGFYRNTFFGPRLEINFGSLSGGKFELIWSLHRFPEMRKYLFIFSIHSAKIFSKQFTYILHKFCSPTNKLICTYGLQINDESKFPKCSLCTEYVCCQINYVKKCRQNNITLLSRKFREINIEYLTTYSVWHLVVQILLKRNLFSKGFSWP